MKNFFLFTAIAITCFAVNAQTLRTPAASPAQTIKQDFGIASVEISYSRPGVKGRKVFGDLVPFGKVWRTGANNATTITFGDTVTIADTKIAPGKYGLLTIPDKDSWTIIISKATNVTSSVDYNMENDVARYTAKTYGLKDKVETFTMQFANVKPSSCELQLAWENTMVSLPITTDVETQVMKQIDNIMNKDTRPYYAAASYYMETGKDLNQALAWLDKAAQQQPNAYWVYHQRANALARLGRKAEAKTAAEKSMELAKAQKNDDYVRLNEKLLAELK
ncbi:MAG: hypothetical protein C4308_07425 [Chitinophagaceae bacterium]